MHPGSRRRRLQSSIQQNISVTQTAKSDYIIVGAGSAGCVLANRLSANGQHKVTLLEAGGRDWNPWIHIPVGYFKTIHNPATDWCYQTEPDPGLAGRSIKWPRGRVLGGSSSINGLLYVRGQHQDYDDWAASGNTGWSWEDVLPYFKRAEDQENGDNDFHATGGPLKVSNMRFQRPICDDFIRAVNSLDVPLNDDINGATQEGVGYFQLTAHKGRRCSAAVAYLNPARSRPNLEIITHAQADRIEFTNGRASAVHLREQGQPRVLRANREIIICAGAVNSPQLLELSGVGPAALLKRYGIPVIHDAPEVGENLQDHLQIRTIYKTKKPVTLNDELSNPLQKAMAGIEYILRRSGPLSMAASQVYAFCRTRLSNDRPDIQYHFQPLSAGNPGEGLHPFSAITASVCQLRPTSRGSIHINSAAPETAPRIVPNYLSTDADCATAVESLKFTRRIMQSDAMRESIASEYLPDPQAQSDEELLQQAREISNTIYHPTSTCRMGSDAGAVVDPQLQVNGVRGLRVVDASVMPLIVSGNTNAPTIMIAEKAADMILAAASS